MAYPIDATVLPFMFVAAIFSGFAISLPFKDNAMKGYFDKLDARIDQLEYELEMRTSQLADVKKALKGLVESISTEYDDMPELVKSE